MTRAEADELRELLAELYPDADVERTWQGTEIQAAGTFIRAGADSVLPRLLADP